MGGSKTKTYIDLQVEKIMDNPEDTYKAIMRQAYKNVGRGMRSVLREYQSGIIDTRSLFNDSYLTALGYNPKETILYRVVDPVLVLSWLKSNISYNVTKTISYRWGIPTIEETALEYLQDTYTGMALSEKSFLIDEVKWYVSGVTNVSTTKTNTTCYMDKVVTAADYALSNGTIVDSIEDTIYKVNGINYWRVTMTNGNVVDIPIQYTTIECPGVASDVVQNVLNLYNGKVYYVNGDESTDSESGETYYEWTNRVTISAYIDSSGSVKVTGNTGAPSYRMFNSSKYIEATKQALANVLEQVKKEIDEVIGESLDRLVVVYELNGVNKIKLVEIDKDIVSSVSQASAYPIIPLRKDYDFVAETNQMKAILNKIGMASDDFETSLDNDKIKNAAVMFLIDLLDTTAVGTKVVFETLVNMVTTTIPAAGKVPATETYQLDFGFDDINMKTNANFNLSTISGSIGSVGTYARYSRSESYEVTEDYGDSISTHTRIGTVHGIRKQIAENYYQELEFGTCTSSWSVGGYELSGSIGLGSTEGEVYIPLTDLGLTGLKYEDLHYAISLSMSVMVLSVVKVKMKWYQSGFFKFIMIIIIAVAAFFTGGAALAAYGPLAAAVVYAAAVVSILGVMGVNTGVVGQVLQVAAAFVTMGTSLASTGISTGQQVLTVASTLTGLASMASQINLEGVLSSLEKKRSELASRLEDSEKQLEEISDNTQQGLWMGVYDRDPELLYAMSSTAMMCNNDILYDYDGMYDGMIASVGV